MDATPSTYYEVWSLGQSNLVARPGERWHYSNVGYKILGLILEQVLERPYREIIQEFILHRLDMHQTSPVITHDSRHQLAIGYDYLYDDRPPYASQPLVPARWIETDSGDGAIAASAEDLARFVRMLMSRGRGPRQHVLSEDSFALMTQRISQIGPVHYYGYGLTTLDQAGHQLIQHRGGMPGYFAAICADMDAGIGVAVLSTGPGGDPISIAQFVLAAARAGAASTPLPSIPPAGDRTWVANAAEYAGRYTGASRSFTIEDVSPQLALVFDDQRIILEPRGLDQFYANHPAFDRLLLCFGRDRHRVVEAGWGSEWFRHERWSGPTSWQVPAMWAAYPGHYRSYGPFLSNVRVVLRKDQLRLIYPWGDERVLLPEGDATFQVDEPVPMRIQFDTVVVGKALRVRLADAEYYRFFTS
jgi:hypothetical protein